jgi:hypothetical protein
MILISKREMIPTGRIRPPITGRRAPSPRAPLPHLPRFWRDSRRRLVRHPEEPRQRRQPWLMPHRKNAAQLLRTSPAMRAVNSVHLHWWSKRRLSPAISQARNRPQHLRLHPPLVHPNYPHRIPYVRISAHRRVRLSSGSQIFHPVSGRRPRLSLQCPIEVTTHAQLRSPEPRHGALRRP